MKINKKGVSILEVLVSMIVLAVGVLGLAPLVVLSISANDMSRDVMTVSELTKEKIETYQNPSKIPSLPFYEKEEGIAGGHFDRYTFIWDSDTDSLIPQGLCYIDVTIKWKDEGGADHTSKSTTILEKDG
jgi:type II secretory pathway pseudopilin PulG